MMNKNKIFGLGAALLAMCVAFAVPALADGGPVAGGYNLQEAATPVMERMTDFHNFLFIIITAVCVFVLGLLLYVMVRFNAKANPKPAKFAHNTLIEVIWTVVPIVILIVISVPSMKLLYYGDRTAEPEMTIKMTGYQWYWGYTYPDHDDLEFMSYMIPEDQIDPSKGQKRLLSVDAPMVVPVDTNIQILTTSADVIHAIAIPAFGVKSDAIPGRINETWFRVTKPGTYYGQCSELCGKDHAFMPIEVRAVSKRDFEAWVRQAKRQYSSYDDFMAKRQSQLAQADLEGVK
jgi:cytochrome c oxidase subunit 2